MAKEKRLREDSGAVRGPSRERRCHVEFAGDSRVGVEGGELSSMSVVSSQIGKSVM